jgi:hypothetical protein
MSTLYASRPRDKTVDAPVNLVDPLLRIRLEMNTTHEPDSESGPEMTAEAWDDYLHRFGAEVYIAARYGSSLRDVALSPDPCRLYGTAEDGSRPVQTGLDQAA